MLVDIYILYSILTFFLFFIGLTDLIKLEKGTRITIMFITFILFFYMAFSSFNIEDMFCSYSSGWECNTESMNDMPLAIFNMGLGVLCLIYILIEALGWMPKEIRREEE